MTPGAGSITLPAPFPSGLPDTPMFDALAGADAATSTLLIVGLLVAFGFEFVNGIHDTPTINARQDTAATRAERNGFSMTCEWRLQR